MIRSVFSLMPCPGAVQTIRSGPLRLRRCWQRARSARREGSGRAVIGKSNERHHRRTRGGGLHGGHKRLVAQILSAACGRM